MIPEKLKQFLDKKFQVVGFVDLADLTNSPVAAFKFFNLLHREEFTPDQRIVIYTSHVPSNEVLAHLYQTTNFIDISNWFVLICSTVDMSEQLREVCQTNSSDTVPFQNLVLPLSESLKHGNNFKMSDTICAIPWTNLEIRQGGEISPCCMSSFNFGNVSSDRLDSVFTGAKMQQLRQQLMDGQRPTECSRCWDQEKQGLTSIRQYNTKRFKQSFMTRYFEEPQIATVDLKFQSTCNFKCRICGPISSSLFAEELSKHGLFKIKSQPRWSESQQFISQMHELLPELNNIDMYGGEPFLIKKFSEVLKTAVDTGVAKNIRLHYNSNGSIWPDRFVEYWPHFQQVDIHFSIDDVGDRFSLQRGGSWQDVEANILRIKNLNFPNMSISIMPSLNIMNVLYINEVVEWARRHDFQIFFNHVTVPAEFGLASLTQEAKNLILAKHKNNVWPEIQEIVKYIESSPTNNANEFCNKTKWFDTVRGENFSETHPEIAKAMGYVYNINNDSHS